MPFFRLLDRSFGFRVLMASIISLALLAIVNSIENCHAGQSGTKCYASNILDIISVGNIEGFSIATAAIVYILEGGRRKEEEHQEMLSFLLELRQAGVRLSLRRIRVLEDLSADGLWEDGFDLQGANLEGLRIPFSRWRGANFTQSILRNADMRGADLASADFSQSDLSGANLSSSNLTGAMFVGAKLFGADLRGAQLDGASFQGADLRDAKTDQSISTS